MRTPLWIIDFNRNSLCREFFDRWWRAYRQNSETKLTDDDRWYYITSVEEKSYEDILRDAGHMTMLRDGQDPLIPSFKGLQRPEVLDVVFLGDVTDTALTIPNFHFWATRLRAALLKEETQWTTVARVHFYGMLWRPNTAAVAPGVSQQTRGFLQELNMLMSQDVNHAPFRSVAFIESPDRTEDKAAALEKMNLALLHLSSNDYLGDEDSHRFVDLSATGVFYEASVHDSQGRFLLSNVLMDKIAHSSEAEFYNPDAAQEYVERHGDMLEAFSGKMLSCQLTDDCPTPNSKTYAYDIVPGISPWSTKFKQVWREYYCDFIPNYKKNLVNRVKRGLYTFVHDYRKKLYHNQQTTVDSVAKMLQKQVFRIFTDTSASDHVSLAQAEAILSNYKKKIEEASTEVESVKVKPFAIPSELKNAAEQAHAENRTPQDALSAIEHKISRHPVAVFALLVRALVLGALLGYLSWTLLPTVTSTNIAMIVTAALGVLPLGVSLLKFRAMRIRINALKQQYVGAMLAKCEDDLRADILNCLHTTYAELLQYCDWMKENKLRFLREHLSVLPPADFSFVESPVLQPLVRPGHFNGEDTEEVLIPPVSPETFDDIQLSGSFGREPLLAFDTSSPTHKVNVEGVGRDLKAVLKDNNLIAKLVKQLLLARTTIKRSVEREAEFLSKDLQGRTLLLLDVSGSMSGQPLNDLKQAVHSLEEAYIVDWIAFNDGVVASSFADGADIDNLNATGGTNFIPPLEMAVQKVGEALYDDIILISDGSPFESTPDILTAAYRLQQPLNTISIGDTGASVMKELSDKTSGMQIVVSNVKELIHWEGKMQALVQLGENGEFSFGELIAKCHIPGCARAMQLFADTCLLSEASTLASLISHYPGKGLMEWGLFTRQGVSLTQTATLHDDLLLLGIDHTAASDRQFLSAMQENIGKLEPSELDGPLMLATLVSLRGVALRDMLWAGLDESCADLNDRSQLESLLFGNPPIKNMYDKLIR